MRRIIFLFTIILFLTQCKKEDQKQTQSPNSVQTLPSDASLTGNYKMCSNSPFYNSAKVNLKISYNNNVGTNYLYLIKEPEVGSFLSSTTNFYENFIDIQNRRDSATNTASSNTHFLNISIRNDTLRIFARTLFIPDTFTTLIYLKQ